MKQIIVVGYPKSGCTWATRLVAELVGCPVGGFWQSEKKEIASEGEDRVSDFRCYKSHHRLAELGLPPNDPETRLVYILRDPRDIAISAANYFQFDRFPKVAALFRRVRRGEKFYRHTLSPLLAGEDYRLERMTEALLHGSAGVHNWVRVSWRDHWQPYEAAGVPIVRYEDLLATPERQAARILRHLGLERTDQEIATAIDNQSFERKKQTLLERGETGRAKFLRVGKSGQWREKLPAPMQARFAHELRAELAQWGYLDGVME
ncbi:MAG: sulfotransferase domain-containing protein [Chthoniobacterales bacterium]